MRPGGAIAEVLLNVPSTIVLLAPGHLLTEMEEHAADFAEELGVTVLEVRGAIAATQRCVNRFVSTNDIPMELRRRAEDALSAIDTKDAAYVALAWANDAMLWTVDRKLSHGLLRARINITIDTATMRALCKHA